jgi:mono/diheme cytochrome c family protein
MLLVSGCSKPANESANSGAKVTPAATATPDEFAFARANYAQHCSSCHGQEGKGGLVKTTEGKMLKVPSLCEGHALKHGDDDYVDQIKNGGDGMPKFKDKLSADEIAALVHCIRHDYQGK